MHRSDAGSRTRTRVRVQVRTPVTGGQTAALVIRTGERTNVVALEGMILIPRSCSASLPCDAHVSIRYLPVQSRRRTRRPCGSVRAPMHAPIVRFCAPTSMAGGPSVSWVCRHATKSISPVVSDANVIEGCHACYLMVWMDIAVTATAGLPRARPLYLDRRWLRLYHRAKIESDLCPVHGRQLAYIRWNSYQGFQAIARVRGKTPTDRAQLAPLGGRASTEPK